MKKWTVVLLVVLTTALLAAALAENMSPSMIAGSRGLMVMDEDQINNLSDPSSEESSSTMPHTDYTYILVAPGGNSVDESSGTGASGGLIWYDGSKCYFAFDMASLFGQSAASTTTYIDVFTDICKNCDFDVCCFADADAEGGAFYSPSGVSLEDFGLSMGGDLDKISTNIVVCASIDELVEYTTAAK